MALSMAPHRSGAEHFWNRVHDQLPQPSAKGKENIMPGPKEAAAAEADPLAQAKKQHQRRWLASENPFLNQNKTIWGANDR